MMKTDTPDPTPLPGEQDRAGNLFRRPEGPANSRNYSTSFKIARGKILKRDGLWVTSLPSTGSGSGYTHGSGPDYRKAVGFVFVYPTGHSTGSWIKALRSGHCSHPTGFQSVIPSAGEESKPVPEDRLKRFADTAPFDRLRERIHPRLWARLSQGGGIRFCNGLWIRATCSGHCAHPTGLQSVIPSAGGESKPVPEDRLKRVADPSTLRVTCPPWGSG